MATTTIWRVYNPDQLLGGYNFNMEKFTDDWNGVTSEPVEVEIPDGFEIVKNPIGQPMFCRIDGSRGYELASTSRWKDSCRPLLIGGDDVEIVRLRVVKPQETD